MNPLPYLPSDPISFSPAPPQPFSPLFSLSPTLPSLLPQSPPPGFGGLPLLPQSPPNHHMAFLPQSPQMPPIQYFSGDHMFPATGLFDHIGTSSTTTDLHFPSFIPSTPQCVSSYEVCSSPMPNQLTAAIIQTISSPVKSSSQPSISQPTLSSVFSSFSNYPSPATTSVVSDLTIGTNPQFQSNLPLCSTPPPTHFPHFSPPPPPPTPTTLSPIPENLQSPSKMYLSTNKDSFFTRVGRMITKRGDNKSPSVLSEHGEDATKQENFTYCDMTDATQAARQTTPNATNASADSSPSKDFNVDNPVKVESETKIVAAASPVTSTAQLFQDKMSVNNISQTPPGPGGQHFNNINSSTNFIGWQWKTPDSNETPLSQAASLLPTTKNVGAIGDSATSIHQDLMLAGIQQVSVPVSVQQSGFHQEAVLSPPLNIMPHLYQVLCPPFN